MRAVGEDFGCQLVEFNGETEHVHLLVNVPPTVALSRLVQQPDGRLVPAAAAGVPRPGPARLAGQAATVGVVLRRLGRRCSVERPAGRHRAAAPTPRRDASPA